MKFHKFLVGLAAATLTLSLTSVWAQDDRGRPRESEPAASRPSNGDNVGSAVPRSSGETASSSSSSSPSSNPSSPSNNSPANAGGPPTSWMDSGSRVSRAPVRPERADRLEAADQRRGNGGQTGGHAVPRGDSGNTSSGSPNATSSSSGSENQPAQGHSRSVPPNSRPRDGRNQTGTAVERLGPPPNGDGHYGDGHYGYGYPAYGYYPSYVYDPFYSFYYSPYYNGYGYWNPYGYGYGLGYFSYDPFLFGAMGYSSYYGAGGGYAGSGGYPESSGGGSYVPHYQGAGSLRLKIKPADAKVYIDGYYVGMVESFDGVFQKLNVDAGPHKVELRADGYETSEFEVVVTPGDTVTYKGDMKRR